MKEGYWYSDKKTAQKDINMLNEKHDLPKVNKNAMTGEPQPAKTKTEQATTIQQDNSSIGGYYIKKDSITEGYEHLLRSNVIIELTDDVVGVSEE